LLEQCPKPAWHDAAGTTHLPMLQVALPLTCCKVVQSCPQEPQFFGSLSVFVHPLQ
jgi:hypothetical protein